MRTADEKVRPLISDSPVVVKASFQEMMFRDVPAGKLFSVARFDARVMTSVVSSSLCGSKLDAD